MGSAGRPGRREVGAIPPEATPPTAPTRGTEEYGRSAAQGTLSTHANRPISFKKMAVAGLHREGWIFPLSGVDIRQSARLYNFLTARRSLGAQVRLRSSSMHLSTRHQLSFDGHKLRRLSGSPGSRDRPGPGLFDGGIGRKRNL